MNSLLNFLEKYKLLAGFLITVYYVLVVTMHLHFGKFVARTLDIPFGRDTYNMIVLGMAFFLCFAFLIWFFKGLKRLPLSERKITLTYLIITLLLIVCSINVIIIINIELIHVLQYAIFAILLFPILQRYYDVLFWTTFFGALDELYQYVYLAPNLTDYYDMNDVVINMVGAAMGLILLRSQGVFQLKPVKPILKSSWFWGVAIIFILIFSLWSVGQLTFFPNGENVFFEFIRDFQPGFWREVPPKTLFHVIQPLEGLVILIILFVIYNKIALIKKYKGNIVVS